MAFSGFLVRDTLSDTGSTTQGEVFLSPDIIPMQSNTLAASTANSTYASYIGPTNFTEWGYPVNDAAINNIYVRTKNLGSSQAGGVSLWYMNTGFLVQPSKWTQVLTANGTGYNPFSDATTTTNGTTVGTNDVGWTAVPFLLTSAEAPASTSSHYCFVAISGTGTTGPSIPSTFTSNAAFQDWVEENANVAWHNFVFIPSTNTSKVVGAQYSNANPGSESYFFSVTATNCPTGTKLTFQDLNAGVNLSATLPSANSQGEQIATTSSATIPGGYSGTLVVGAVAPTGQTFSSKYTMRPTAYQVSSEGASEREKRSARPFRRLRPKADGTIEESTVKVLALGTIMMLDGGSGQS